MRHSLFFSILLNSLLVTSGIALTQFFILPETDRNFNVSHTISDPTTITVSTSNPESGHQIDHHFLELRLEAPSTSTENQFALVPSIDFAVESGLSVLEIHPRDTQSEPQIWVNVH